MSEFIIYHKQPRSKQNLHQQIAVNLFLAEMASVSEYRISQTTTHVLLRYLHLITYVWTIYYHEDDCIMA